MKPIASLVLRLVVSLLLGQTLFFKFTGADESKMLFTELGMEPWGRYGTGVVELIAIILILFPRTIAYGAALAVGLMVGALGSHVQTLGFQGERGVLAGLAVIILLCSIAVLLLHRSSWPIFASKKSSGLAG